MYADVLTSEATGTHAAIDKPPAKRTGGVKVSPKLFRQPLSLHASLAEGSPLGFGLAGAFPFEETTMTRAAQLFALASALTFGMTFSPVAATKGEFDGECVMGLALGKEIKTDCSVNTVYAGSTYCFGNETARDLFLKKPDEFLLKAQIFYSSKPPQPQP